MISFYRLNRQGIPAVTQKITNFRFRMVFVPSLRVAPDLAQMTLASLVRGKKYLNFILNTKAMAKKRGGLSPTPVIVLECPN